MKNNRLLFLSIAAMFGFLTSCHVEDKLAPESKRKPIDYVDGVSSKEGIPIYKNWSEFNKHMNGAVKSVTSLYDYEKKYSFRTLLGEYIRTINDSTYKETSELITKSEKGPQLEAINYGYAALVNKDGFAIIGAGMYRFKGEAIYSIELGGVNLDKAKTTLKEANPENQNSLIHVDYYKASDSKQARKQNTSYVVAGSATWDFGGYSKFFMTPEIRYGTTTYVSYSCPGYMVYDEDARDYVCSEQVVYEGTSTSGFIYITNTITYKHCPPFWFCSAVVVSDPSWIQSNQANGNYSYYFNGVLNSGTFSINVTSPYLFQQVADVSVQGDYINFSANSAYSEYICYLKDDQNNIFGNFGLVLNF